MTEPGTQYGSSPQGDPPYIPEYGPSSRSRRRWWLLALILIPALIVVAFVGLVVFGVITYVTHGRQPDQPLAEGPPAQPSAVSPLVCDLPCFGESSIAGTLAAKALFAELGVPEYTFPSGTYDPMTVGQLFRRDATSWESYNGDPDSCFFAPTSAPYAASLEDQSQSPDVIHFTGEHEDEDRLNSVDQAVRIFADSASAEAFMSELSSSIRSCEWVELGPDRDRYYAMITPQPALAVPEQVAAIGWTRTGDPGERWRAYVIDIQYGNLVIMTRLLTDGSISEQDFRDFVERYAVQVAAIAPEPAAG